jgi:tRNA G18 (ribose-2'-O)-methylase SpoU
VNRELDRQLGHVDHRPAVVRRSVSVLLNNFQAPANVGAVFRSADAFGVARVFLCGATVAPPNAKLRRLSRAAEKYVPWQQAADALPLVQTLKAQGTAIVSLELTRRSIPLAQWQSPEGDLCLVLGVEDSGVSPELLMLSDAVVHIPMLGQLSSLNVGSACAVALYELACK